MTTTTTVAVGEGDTKEAEIEAEEECETDDDCPAIADLNPPRHKGVCVVPGEEVEEENDVCNRVGHPR